jgi:hypothetical protein
MLRAPLGFMPTAIIRQDIYNKDIYNISYRNSLYNIANIANIANKANNTNSISSRITIFTTIK